MAAKRDYYKVLGISEDANSYEIKRAFRKLAFHYHPDHNYQEGAEEKFKEINEAYQVLSNTEKRKQYDQFGRVFEGGGFPGGQAGWDFGFGQGFDASDFDLGDIFGEMFGFGGTASKKDLKRGQDI